MWRSETSRFSVGAVLTRAVVAFVAAGLAAFAGWTLLMWWDRSFESADSADWTSDDPRQPEGRRSIEGLKSIESSQSIEASIDELSDEEKQRLLDELGKQL